MPKLNTTVDNLELKSNKVIGTFPSADWTDAQYPSAKTLYNAYDKTHAVGSILITSTNTSPAETFGGEWELVDKEFKNMSITSGVWESHNGSFKEGSVVILAGHTISVNLNLSTSMAIASSTVDLGRLKLELCGITALPFANVAIAGSTSNPLIYEQSTDGTIKFTKTLSGNSIASSTVFPIHFERIVEKSVMLDTFCDKFYWKRIA